MKGPLQRIEGESCGRRPVGPRGRRTERLRSPGEGQSDARRAVETDTAVDARPGGARIRRRPGTRHTLTRHAAAKVGRSLERPTYFLAWIQKRAHQGLFFESVGTIWLFWRRPRQPQKPWAD